MRPRAAARITGAAAALLVAVPVGGAALTSVVVHHAHDPSLTIVRRDPARVIGVATGHLAVFEHATGVHPDVSVRYVPWGQVPPLAWFRALEKTRVMPLVELQPGRSDVSGIAPGRYDGYLRRMAARVRAARGRVAVSLSPQMNGNWSPWKDHPAAFVAAWRHVVTVFRRAGARNITWTWIAHSPRLPLQLHEYWPGSGWAAWAAMDGFDTFSRDTFTRVFGPTMAAIRSFARGVPLLIGQTAVGPAAGSSPPRIRDLFAGVRRHHLLGLIWLDIQQDRPPFHQDWRLENRPPALRAFRAAVSAMGNSATGNGAIGNGAG